MDSRLGEAIGESRPPFQQAALVSLVRLQRAVSFPAYAGGVGEHLARMLGGNHPRVRRRNFSLFVDQVTDPGRITRFRIGARAIRQTDLTLDVAQQFEREIELFGKRGVGRDIVKAYAHNDNVIFSEIGILVTEPATFGRSTGRVSFGIEPKQHFVPAKGGQRKRLPFVGQQGEIRRLVPDLQHACCLLENPVLVGRKSG